MYTKEQEEAERRIAELYKSNWKDLSSYEGSPYVGPKDADIVIVEFFDFNCGYCKRLAPELMKVIKNNPDVKVVFKPVTFLGSMPIAKAAMAAFGLGEVRLMPCAQQALKALEARAPARAEDRCAMLRLAIAGEPGLTLDCRELFRRGPTHTYDTLTELRAECPGARFWFIVGMDSVRDFPRWHRAGELVGLCEFIAFDRPGVDTPERPFDPRLLAHRLRGPLSDASSTKRGAGLGHRPGAL